jgi:hypothetical protein
MGAYAIRHPGALTARYEATTIARDGLSGIGLVLQAVGNWFRDINPWHWATAGDPAPYIHNGGYGAFFGGVMALALAGAVLVLLRKRADRWWRFVLLATLLVPVPAALTVDRFNAIRLAVLPVFMLVLAIPALEALVGARAESANADCDPCARPESARADSGRAEPWRARSLKAAAARPRRHIKPLVGDLRRSWPARVAVVILALSIGAQFVQFLDMYRTRGPARLVLFDAGVGPLLEQPLASGETIHVDYDDRGAQAQVRWHAAEAGVPQSRIVVLPDGGIPAAGSIVLSLFQECDFVCEEFARWEDYRLSRAVGPRPG